MLEQDLGELNLRILYFAWGTGVDVDTGISSGGRDTGLVAPAQKKATQRI
jgi:hypothetical protein